MQKIIVTGAAGFIGYHLSQRLCAEGREVLGIDIVNDYYDVGLKEGRLSNLKDIPNFRFEKAALEDAETLMRLAKEFQPDAIVHLAAQAGVRYSLENPFAYERSNLGGHLSILEAARHNGVTHLVYASSSSVYGDRPIDGAGFREDDPTVWRLGFASFGFVVKSEEVGGHSHSLRRFGSGSGRPVRPVEQAAREQGLDRRSRRGP